MTRFQSGNLDIAYYDEGEGDPILLIHGFASNAQKNWFEPGWVSALKRAGRRVVAIDNRGHGQSDKPYDPELYASPTMAEDARALLDHLEIARADVMGYSMGARITTFLALKHPERVRSAVLGGVGTNLVKGVGGVERIVAALEAESLEAISDPLGRAFRQFAEVTGSDLKALSACMRAGRDPITPELLASLCVPTLVAVGTRDDIAGSPDDLAAHIPGAEVAHIPDRDHMLAVGDRAFKSAVAEFLSRRP
jgi:pimeloyl-ACP methyl ester carboxylesterase